jgi:hypothetical protein
MKGKIVGKPMSDSRWDSDKLSESPGAPVVSARNAENLAAIAKVYFSAQTTRTSATVNRRIKRDAVARSKITYICTDSFHNAGRFVSHDNGWNAASRGAVIAVNIAAADSACRYANEELVGAERWDRKIGEFKMSVLG